MRVSESRHDCSTNLETRVLAMGPLAPTRAFDDAVSQRRWKCFHLFSLRSWSRHDWYHLAVGEQLSEENTGDMTFTVFAEANFSYVNSTVRCRGRSVCCESEIAKTFKVVQHKSPKIKVFRGRYLKIQLRSKTLRKTAKTLMSVRWMGS